MNPDPGDNSAHSNASTPSWRAGLWAWLKKWGRWLLFALGILGVGLLVRHHGPQHVFRTLADAAAWLPLLAALEIAWVVTESLALWRFYGLKRAQISWVAWMRTVMAHHMVMVILPAGRTGAEVARAAMLAPAIGSGQAAAGAARIQALTLIANALVCGVCLIAVGLQVGATHALFLLLLGNAVVTLVGGVGMHWAMRRTNMGGWLGKRFASLSQGGSDFDAYAKQGPTWPWMELLYCFIGRGFQTIQYGFFLAAVGGVLSVHGGLLAQAIHLVGAGLGDLVPNQAGVTEGIYTFFAESLGFGDDPARAMSIALLARLVSLTLAGCSFLMLRFVLRGGLSPNAALSNSAQNAL